jgi:hypothetical protein
LAFDRRPRSTAKAFGKFLLIVATWAATVAAPIGQGDFAGYGGLNRPIMVYQMDSYRYWERELGRNNFSYGQFGENFTVDGLPDDEVCIGDRYDPVESRHRAQGTRLYAVFRFGDDPVTCEPVSGRNSLLFNGRTADSDSVNLGSNPGSPAKSHLSPNWPCSPPHCALKCAACVFPYL